MIPAGNSKHCNLDQIPTSLLKNSLVVILPMLTDIVNSSLQSGCFPDSLKQAIVTPLLKKPSLNSDDFKNYRPVINLSYVSKLIECCAMEQINKHLTSNSMRDPCQSAYRRHHSTETALIKITNDLLCAMDDKQCVLLVMLDLSGPLTLLVMLFCSSDWRRSTA